MKRAIYLAIFVALLGAALLQHFRIERLKTENGQLRAQASAVPAESRIPKPLAETPPPSDADAAKMAELLRLRSEVGILRRATNELGQVRAKLDALQKQQRPLTNAVRVGSPNALPPKSQWAFVGYATPEATFQSALWAISQGDAKAFAVALAPEDAKDFLNDEDAAKDLRELAAQLTDVAILERRTLSDSEVMLKVQFTKGQEVEEEDVPVKLIAGEWKMVEKEEPQPK